MPHALVAEESADLLRSAAGEALLAATVAAVREVEPGADADATLDAIAAGASGDGRSCTWTLDPVDGTKGFLRNGQYAIALARLEDGEVTLAALGCPALPSDPAGEVQVPDPVGSLFLAAEASGRSRSSRIAASRASPRAKRVPRAGSPPARGPTASRSRCASRSKAATPTRTFRSA
jgi:3'-phosphoadenosine 5'-phosphosulfate (PAPS) 3'-phosphatase